MEGVGGRAGNSTLEPLNEPTKSIGTLFRVNVVGAAILVISAEETKLQIVIILKCDFLSLRLAVRKLINISLLCRKLFGPYHMSE